MAESCLMTSGNALYINLYTEWRAETAVDGRRVLVETSGRYLADSRAVIKVTFLEGEPCELRLRIPSWSKRATVLVEGREYHPSAGYFSFVPTSSRTEIEVRFDSEIKIVPISAHRETEEDPWKPLRWTSDCPAGGCPEELYLTENRCLLQKGAVLLCRSKLIGNTEEEMFGGAHVDPAASCDFCEVEADEGINVKLHAVMRWGDTVMETDICDYASGSNFLSDDVHAFSIYF